MGARENKIKCQISLYENAGILKISYVRSHFVKFDIYFLELSREIVFGVITGN